VLNWNFASAFLWVPVTLVIYETAVRFGFKIDLTLENLPRCFATMGVAHAIVHCTRWRERNADSCD
jgi:hypothetical protein